MKNFIAGLVKGSLGIMLARFTGPIWQKRIREFFIRVQETKQSSSEMRRVSSDETRHVVVIVHLDRVG